MGFLKLEVNIPELTKAIETFKSNRIKAFEAMGDELKSVVSRTKTRKAKWRAATVMKIPKETK
jgi:hypothetical protein